MTHDVRKGDTVRVVLEGKVSYVSSGGSFDIGGHSVWRSQDSFTGYHKDVKSVTVLDRAKPPLKVGDVIEGEDAFNSLPKGAVVVGGDDVCISDGKGNMAHSYGGVRRRGETHLARKLVYLPPAGDE